MRLKFLSVALLISCSLWAQKPQVSIIPEPVEVKMGQGEFKINRQTKVFSSDVESAKSVAYFIDYVNKHYGYPLEVVKKPISDNFISFTNDKSGKKSGTYTLNVTDKGVSINGTDGPGTFYGMHTLLQMLPERAGNHLILPVVTINDYPRFEYRGMMLDVVRHFFPLEFVKKYIDYLALHKLNYFHWHLTDDQAWRIEMKSHPELTQQGSDREGEIVGLYPGVYKKQPYGGYYTQEQIKEVVKYAADRYITVIPEIDIPAHCMALLSVHPEFSTTPNEVKKPALTWGIYNKFNNVIAPRPEVLKFLTEVFTELCGIFPGQYIHVGGDEAAKKWWKEDPVTQQFMKDNKLKDEMALQSYFIRHAQKAIEAKGKTIVGWDEILEGGVSQDAVIMSWQGTRGGQAAAKEGHKVIMTPSSHSYYNNMQSRNQAEVAHQGYVPLDKVYNYQIVPEGLTPEQEKFIWGAQGCLWTEYYPTTAKVEWAIFPRMSALSENVWSQADKKDWNKFVGKMEKQFNIYDLWGARYCDAFFQIQDIKRFK